jgi:pimeloyl-ACP methyl ester carboxylesterase
MAMRTNTTPIINRRRFLRAAGRFSLLALTAAGSVSGRAQPGDNTVRQVRTPVLDIGYEQHGDPTGFPIVLLHGFPYDVRSFDDVAPQLAADGFRVLLPYLRGYGPTRFVDQSQPRMAEQAALAQDLLDFCDALNLQQVALAGFDWGNRAACIAAITNPQRIRSFVSIGGYSVQDTTVTGQPAAAALEARLWYQWYFNTERGRLGLETNRHDIIRHLWDTWSPGWTYSDADYQRSAPSFDNPDFVDVVIHSYRHRHANAPGEERFLELERMLAGRPTIEVPTIVLRAAESGFGPPSRNPEADQRRFPNLVARHVVTASTFSLKIQTCQRLIPGMPLISLPACCSGSKQGWRGGFPFKCQQVLLGRQATAESHQPAAAANHPMTGNDNGYGILAVGSTYRPAGRWTPDLGRQFTVADGFPVRDRA